MTTHKSYSEIEAKWIHVHVKGLCGFQTVVVLAGVTVEQFKYILGCHAEAMVTVPAAALPLPNEANLFDFVQEFDTVLLHA